MRFPVTFHNLLNLLQGLEPFNKYELGEIARCKELIRSPERWRNGSPEGFFILAGHLADDAGVRAVIKSDSDGYVMQHAVQDEAEGKRMGYHTMMVAPGNAYETALFEQFPEAPKMLESRKVPLLAIVDKGKLFVRRA